MDKIVDTTRLAEQEMGLSTLFLALGFLEWYDSPSSDRKVFAPLLLLPVRLEAAKSKGKKIYYLWAREGSAEINLSLQKRLEQFGCLLPEFDTGEDEKASSVDNYLGQVKSVIEGGTIDGWQRWNVRRWLVLGHFAFGRSAMYAELRPENWKADPVTHDLVSAILSGVERKSGDDGGLLAFRDDHGIDDPETEKIAPWLIHDADASQHSALIDVMLGKNLVIQGPPGTGKSQTITNIIANAMAAGKRVLFLSEKQAALDVVKRRLESAGLGDFCLELHSDKSSPKSVIEDLKRRAEAGLGQSRPPVQLIDTVWRDSRLEIATYLRDLHNELPDGTTAFKLIWSAVRGRNQFGNAAQTFKAATLPDRLFEDPEAWAGVEGKIAIFLEASSSFAQAHGHLPAESPWRQLDLGAIESHAVSLLLELLSNVQNSSVELAAFIASTSGLGLASPDDVAALIKADGELGEPPAPEIVPIVASERPDEMEQALALMAEWHRHNRLLSGKSNVSHVSSPHLAIASGLMGCGLSAELGGMTPAELYSHAQTRIANGKVILKVIQDFRPFLELFGLDERSPSGIFVPLAVAAQVSGKIQPVHRPWINAFTSVNPTKFWELNRYWSDMVKNDAKWRASCNVYASSPWPNPEDLEKNAAALAQSGIKKARAAMLGRLRSAREFAASLGFGGAADASDLMTRLAEHVRAVHSLEKNEFATTAFGSYWHGLTTPLNEIGVAFKLREIFRENIGALQHGEQVAERLISLAPTIFERLSNNLVQEAAVKFSKLPDLLREEFDHRSVKNLSEAWNSELRLMEKVLAADPSRSLVAIELPVAEMAEIARMRHGRDEAKRGIDASPAGNTALRLGGEPESVAAAVSTVAWVRAVRRADIDEQLRDRLLSADARDQRLRLRAAAVKAKPLQNNFVAALSDLPAFFGNALNSKDLGELVRVLDELLVARTELWDLLPIDRYRAALVKVGLGEFLARSEELRIPPRQLLDLLKAVVAERRATQIFASTTLAKNNGMTLGVLRRQFASRDRKKIESDRAHIRKVLLQGKPLPGSNYGPRKTWTEMAMLQNEFEKQKRFAPVRSLVSRAGRSIQALKPCFMMSPLSLAKFIPAGLLDFDLLVIDEASQMKPEDALGSLLRSKQIVVVGDQKQLPPTDFFNRVGEASDDENFEDLDDESILEGCQKTFREVRRLKWHYRSRCESLIRFSNETFYRDNPLITFPAAKPDSFSIDLIRVNGSYQFRRNVAEASMVAQRAVELMRRCAHMDAEAIPTLGIVAVNIEQRDLLLEELSRVSAGDPLVEEYQEKVAKKGEPVFVKNLENVQGDERDVILISLTYGRQPRAAAMAQRFGPINGKQGHRRLNVLFTRARLRIGLFSSFGSIDVVPTEKSAEGVRVLKRYLEYAEGMGRLAIDALGEKSDSDFELEVADRLRARSFDVEAQVGVSGFKIDIGVRDPDHPQRFLAGIECDGARYHSSKSARDRDRLREEILRGLGWEIIRVWSTDWFGDPARETDKLVKKLQELRERARTDFDEMSVLPEILSARRESAGQSPTVPEEPNQHIPNSPAGSNEDSAAPPTVSMTRAEPPTLSSLSGTEPLTREQLMKALIDFRDTVIRSDMSNWEPQRSILRDGMIETFISQNLTDPDDWFRKVPTFLRQGTNPVEKNKYLERICDLVARLGCSQPEAGTRSTAELKLTAPEERAISRQDRSPFGTGSKAAAGPAQPLDFRRYAVADLSSNGFQPEASRFYDASYRPTLRKMIAFVIETEAPVYEDMLVDRIARGHGFQRSGSNIYQTISRMLGREHVRSDEGGRSVIWANGMSPNKPFPYRKGAREDRSHLDVPIAELASLAVPYVRLRMSNEDAVRKLAEHFDLGRLREIARGRFEAAVKMAQQN
jgi:very-short-patch-repair endonuclease